MESGEGREESGEGREKFSIPFQLSPIPTFRVFHHLG
jgi:hypothetical protein